MILWHTFLKNPIKKKGTYLQIYESFYYPKRKGPAHKSYKALGYVKELQEKGIYDPIAFYKEEVAELNKQLSEERQKNSVKQISNETPKKLL